MSIKNLYVYNSPKLFEILDEIKSYLNMEVYHVDDKTYKKTFLDESENYLVITNNPGDKNKKNLLVLDSAKKISKLIEQINLNYLKTKFNKQSNFKIGKYILDLNSRTLSYENNFLNLTEKESDMLIFINKNKKVSLKKLQENVWKYASNLETHTVETHVYRLRKKILKTFNDNSLIENDRDGYFIVE